MRVMMVVVSGVAYLGNAAVTRARYLTAARMHFEAPLTQLVWVTSLLSVALTYVVSKLMIPDLGGDASLWWKLSTVITCGTLAGAIIPELVKVFTSTTSSHVREVVSASREGGLAQHPGRLVAGNFSAYWVGLAIRASWRWPTSSPPLAWLVMQAPAVFAFGLVAFGFLGMGPVTIAVDSYAPWTDNAQSVYELSTIEQLPEAAAEIRRDHGSSRTSRWPSSSWRRTTARATLQGHGQDPCSSHRGVGATTMIFSIIVASRRG